MRENSTALKMFRNCSRRLFHTARPLYQEVKAHKPSLLKRSFQIAWKTTAIAALASTAYITYSIYEETNPGPQKPQTATHPNGAPKKRIVILGSGWGAVSLLKNIDSTEYNVSVVSPRNYFLFTPLLPSAPTGVVELRSIIEPIRSIARRLSGEVLYYEAEATEVDAKAKTVKIKGKDSNNKEVVQDLSYDYLVMAVGAKPNTFGIPGVYENASFLKELNDAQEIRKKILGNIESASALPKDDPERKRLLNFVVVGGGPTGVEFAAELQDFVHQDLSKWYPEVVDDIQVNLIEALPNVLNMLSEKLVNYTQKVIKEEKINLKLQTMVKKVDDKTITAQVKNPDGSSSIEQFPYGMLIWATGNGCREVTNNLAKQFPEQTFANRGLLIDDNLNVLGSKDIFAIGDCTLSRKYAPTAQVAYQEGIYLAHVFKTLNSIDLQKYNLMKSTNVNEKAKYLAQIDKTNKIEPFQYTHFGTLAYVGGEKAVAELSWGNWTNLSLAGSLTFLFWKSAYVGMCLSFRNRCLVTLDWLKCSVFGRNSSRED